MVKTYTEKQMQEFIDKNNKDWNELIVKKYILRSEHKEFMKIIDSRRKKDFRILLRGIQDLNKTIKKLKEQEIFLNELLDNRESDLNNKNSKIKKAKEDLD